MDIKGSFRTTPLPNTHENRVAANVFRYQRIGSEGKVGICLYSWAYTFIYFKR